MRPDVAPHRTRHGSDIVVTILSPAEDLNLPPGSDVEIEAEITDDHDGAGWKIMIYKDGELVDDRPSFNFQKQWSLSGLPQSVYTVRVQAIDHDRNIGFDEVVLHVGTEAPGSGSDSSTGSETTAEPTASSSDGGADADTSETQAPASDSAGGSGSATGQASSDDDGCACGVDGSPASTAPLAVLAVLTLRRRRRTQ